MEAEVNLYKSQVKEKDQQLELKHYEVENMQLRIKQLTTQLQCDQKPQVVNNYNITNVNHYYVLDKDGIRDGLDMTKLRTFGTENVDYIDKTKPLPTILMDIYMNDAHPENRVLSHEFLNLEWIMFRFKDHILRLHLEIDRDNFHIFYRMVCDNVEKLLGQTYDNADERYDAARQLLRAMDNEVLQLEKKVGLKKAFEMLPIWNREQVEGVEARMWKQYMNEPNYSQNLRRA